MSDVFISYKAEDRRRIQPLVHALQADGYSVWWDEHIGTGDEWRQTIELQLDSARCVLVIWSKRSVGTDGHFVRDEASRAQRRHVYVPILIDAVESPLGFGESQATSLRGWHGDRTDSRYQAVLSAVRRIAGAGSQEAAPQAVQHAWLSRRAMIGGGAVVAAVVAGGSAWMFFERRSTEASDSIAVLPFANLSGDPAQAYFSDGIAEELRSALARLAGLKVVGRTSSEAVRNDDAETAAKKLNVANILTGSVRQSPSMVRVSAQLVDGRNGLERWSQSYDRAPGDAIKIQTDIAENVARALSVALGSAGRAALTAGQTASAAAHDQFLKALAIYSSSNSRPSLEQTIASLDSAIRLDPNYADAYALRARALMRLTGSHGTSSDWARGFAEAEANARKAIAQAPALAAAHAALAAVLSAQLDFAAAMREFREAQKTARNDVAFLMEYSTFLSDLGFTRESLALAREAVDLDPLNPRAIWMETRAYFVAKRYEEAIASAKRVLALSPGLPNAHVMIGDCLVLLGRTDEAAAQYSRLPADDYQRLTSEAILAARIGQRRISNASLEKLLQLYGDSVTYQVAQIRAQQRETQEALQSLERAYAIRDPGLVHAKGDPWLDPLRSEPGFAEFLKRAGFLA